MVYDHLDCAGGSSYCFPFGNYSLTDRLWFRDNHGAFGIASLGSQACDSHKHNPLDDSHDSALLFEVRSHVKPARVTPLLIASIAAIPGGILLIRHIDPDALQIVIASIAIVVAVRLLFRPKKSGWSVLVCLSPY